MMVAMTRSLSSLACACLRGVQAGVLPGADGPLELARGGGVGGAAGVLQDAGDVVGVEDGELRLQPQHRAVLPHHAHAQRVEGADQHVLGLAAHQRLGALAHFGGGLVGEGDGRDALGSSPAWIRRPILCVITRVLPEPAPASTRQGPCR
jgi:hypothetical protein